MRIPAFMKTIRSRLTLWYSVLLLLFGLLFILGLNLAMHQALNVIRLPEAPGPPWTPAEIVRMVSDDNLVLLRNYCIIGLGALLVLGAVGGYFFSGRMLRPVDKVTSLAARISHTNLNERINHRGPDDEVKRLADTFDDMLERLDTAFESQKQFIEDASHELKTPIAAAQANIEVLEMDPSPTVEDYRNLVEVVKRSLDRLNRVSQGLLLLSQGTGLQDGYAEVNLGSVIEEVAAEARPGATSVGIGLQVQTTAEAVVAKGDPVGIKQVVANLVDNAVKYNRPEGAIRISARVEGSTAVIEVSDTGIGIPAEDHERIFGRFYRVDKSRSRSHGGSGLGLAIVRKIVEEHGGTIFVQSELGKGSTFRVSLPRQS